MPGRKAELRRAIQRQSRRGLVHSARWAAELLSGFGETSEDKQPPGAALPDRDESDMDSVGWAERDRVTLAKTFFDMKEYIRCAAALRGAKSDLGLFLRRYATYLAGEKRKMEQRTELPGWQEPENRELPELRTEFEAAAASSSLDGFGYYLFGVVLDQLGLRQQAIEALKVAVRAEPCFWCAWEQLAKTMVRARNRKPQGKQPNSTSGQNPPGSEILPREVPSAAELRSLTEKHWMGQFFEASMALDCLDYERALELYRVLDGDYPMSAYVSSQKAVVLYHLREFDEAQAVYELVRKMDPNRLDHIDNYSNILYVKECLGELSSLANTCMTVDKFRCETCCVVGNYHSLKGQHEQAVTWFQRALTLNRRYLPAWTLLGHEYMELKNTGAAVEAYRQALDVDPSDHRAWYALGQAYELLDLPLYSLYYYKRVVSLRPDDARMWCAVGHCYEELKRPNDAIECYKRAKECNDLEGISLRRLASLYEKMKQTHLAFQYHELSLQWRDEQGLSGPETAESLRFLAQFFLQDPSQDDRAEQLLTRLLDFAGPEKDWSKAQLRELHSKRRKNEGSSATMRD